MITSEMQDWWFVMVLIGSNITTLVWFYILGTYNKKD